MMKLEQVIGNTWCLTGKQLLPVYRTDSTHCILMDTGAQFMRKEIEEALERYNLIPIGLLCTHTHFDHFGNATYFREKYGCPVALPLGEAEICRTEASVKSHMFVFSAGQIANDPKMRAIPCLVDHIIRPEETDTMFRGVIFRALHTPGHALDHVSYITPDNVCYVGDALMSGRSLQVSKLPYAFNMRQSMDTIRALRDIHCDAMIVAHNGIIYEGFAELADKNLRVMEERLAQVAALVDHPMNADEICRAVCEHLGVEVSTPEKAQNLERFLRPYLECMIDDGTHELVVVHNSLCYAPAVREG